MDFVTGKKIRIDYDRTKDTYAVRLGSEVVHIGKTEELCQQWLEDERKLEDMIARFFSRPPAGTNPLKLVYNSKEKWLLKEVG